MTPKLFRLFTLTCISLAALAAGSCKSRKDFPEPSVGWHSPSYNVVYGTIRKIAAPNPSDPPTWVVVYGPASGPHEGMLALTPPVKLTGYSGGERVQLKGHILPDATTDAYNGRWYVIDSIQLWVGYR